MSIKKISFSDYVKVDALNCSSLVNIEKSPLHFQWAKANPRDTKTLVNGRAVHTLILEPELFNEIYAVEPRKEDYKFVTIDDLKQLCEKYGTKKSGKKEDILKELSTLISEDERKQIYDFTVSAFYVESQGKEILSTKEYQEAKAIADSVLKSPRVQAMLKKGQSECSIFQTVEGVSMKFRLDFFVEGSFFLDVKTCRSCEPREFVNDFINYSYDVKCAAYQHAIFLETGKQIPCVILACETTDELDYKVYEIDQEFLDIGLKKFFKLLNKWKECTDKNEWPGMNKKVEKLFPPEWYLKKEYTVE